MQPSDKAVPNCVISASVRGPGTLAWQAELSLVQQVSQLSATLPTSQTVFRLFGAVHTVRSGFETLPVGQLMLKKERGDVRMDNELHCHYSKTYSLQVVASGTSLYLPASH